MGLGLGRCGLVAAADVLLFGAEEAVDVVVHRALHHAAGGRHGGVGDDLLADADGICLSGVKLEGAANGPEGLVEVAFTSEALCIDVEDAGLAFAGPGQEAFAGACEDAGGFAGGVFTDVGESAVADDGGLDEEHDLGSDGGVFVALEGAADEGQITEDGDLGAVELDAFLEEAAEDDGGPFGDADVGGDFLGVLGGHVEDGAAGEARCEDDAGDLGGELEADPAVVGDEGPCCELDAGVDELDGLCGAEVGDGGLEVSDACADVDDGLLAVEREDLGVGEDVGVGDRVEGADEEGGVAHDDAGADARFAGLVADVGGDEVFVVADGRGGDAGDIVAALADDVVAVEAGDAEEVRELDVLNEGEVDAEGVGVGEVDADDGGLDEDLIRRGIEAVEKVADLSDVFFEVADHDHGAVCEAVAAEGGGTEAGAALATCGQAACEAAAGATTTTAAAGIGAGETEVERVTAGAGGRRAPVGAFCGLDEGASLAQEGQGEDGCIASGHVLEFDDFGDEGPAIDEFLFGVDAVDVFFLEVAKAVGIEEDLERAIEADVLDACGDETLDIGAGDDGGARADGEGLEDIEEFGVLDCDLDGALRCEADAIDEVGRGVLLSDVNLDDIGACLLVLLGEEGWRGGREHDGCGRDERGGWDAVLGETHR